MSDPFCLALTVVPILSAWGTASPDAAVDDDDELPHHHNHHHPDGATTKMQKLLMQDYTIAFEDWWKCIALQCQPCATDCFFQLDEDDEAQGEEVDSSPEAYL